MKLQTLASSADPQKASVAVRGFLLLAVVPVVRLVVMLKGGVANDPSLNDFIDAVAKITEAAVSVFATGMIVFGYLRRAYLWLRGTSITQ